MNLKCAGCGNQLTDAEAKAKSAESHKLCDACFKAVIAEMSKE